MKYDQQISKSSKEKINKSIEVLKQAAYISDTYYNKPLIIAYSGGKDSDIMLDLALKAEINFEVLYSTTTVEAPQTMKHIADTFKRLKAMKIKTIRTKPTLKGEPINMFSLIAKKKIVPTRIIRYCCQIFKEVSTPRRITAVGVRSSESRRRKNRSDFTIKGKSLKHSLHFDLDHVKEVFEEAKTRDPIWDCTIVTRAKGQKDLVVNSIYDWTDEDVWKYINENKITYNPLYDLGFKRVGCVLCPLASRKNKIREAEMFPTIKENYMKAIERMIRARKEAGLDCSDKKFSSPKVFYKWWVEES